MNSLFIYYYHHYQSSDNYTTLIYSHLEAIKLEKGSLSGMEHEKEMGPPRLIAVISTVDDLNVRTGEKTFIKSCSKQFYRGSLS